MLQYLKQLIKNSIHWIADEQINQIGKNVTPLKLYLSEKRVLKNLSKSCGWTSIARIGPVDLMKRPLRTRMLRVVV